jgi:hypothetical protein
LKRKDLRLLYVLGNGIDYSPGAAWTDTKLWAGHLAGWKRVAIVAGSDDLESAVTAFSWLVPGKVKLFEDDEVSEAKAWLVGITLDDDDD